MNIKLGMLTYCPGLSYHYTECTIDINYTHAHAFLCYTGRRTIVKDDVKRRASESHRLIRLKETSFRNKC